MKLEEKYSWEELYEQTFSKIGHKLQKKDIPVFKTWFMKREGVGYRFDYQLILRAFRIWQELHDGLDHFCVISGREGFGKSTLAIQLCSWVNPNFRLTNLCYGAKAFLDILGAKADKMVDSIDKGEEFIGETESLLLDEGTELLSREALNVTNRTLTKSFFIQRALKFFVVICIPNFHMLDPVVRDHRCRTLIEVIGRGKYKAVTGDGIKTISKEGKITKEISRVSLRNGQFWHGYYNKEFPKDISHLEYEKQKFYGIKEALDTMKDDVVTKKLISVTKTCKEIGLKADTLIGFIKKGEVEGKQIGKRWYISRKAYDKLLQT